MRFRSPTWHRRLVTWCDGARWGSSRGRTQRFIYTGGNGGTAPRDSCMLGVKVVAAPKVQSILGHWTRACTYNTLCYSKLVRKEEAPLWQGHHSIKTDCRGHDLSNVDRPRQFRTPESLGFQDDVNGVIVQGSECCAHGSSPRHSHQPMHESMPSPAPTTWQKGLSVVRSQGVKAY